MKRLGDRAYIWQLQTGAEIRVYPAVIAKISKLKNALSTIDNGVREYVLTAMRESKSSYLDPAEFFIDPSDAVLCAIDQVFEISGIGDFDWRSKATINDMQALLLTTPTANSLVETINFPNKPTMGDQFKDVEPEMLYLSVALFLVENGSMTKAMELLDQLTPEQFNNLVKWRSELTSDQKTALLNNGSQPIADDTFRKVFESIEKKAPVSKQSQNQKLSERIAANS